MGKVFGDGYNAGRGSYLMAETMMFDRVFRGVGTSTDELEDNMTTVFDVPADRLIDKLTEELKTRSELTKTEWSGFVKTGRHREKRPIDPEWWHKRLAAVLRKVYVHGPIGSSRLSAYFGGSADRGSKPNRATKGSRAIARYSLKQLEQAGLIITEGHRGRRISPEGQRLLDNTAHKVLKEMIKDRPEMVKYD